jgi:hypothetical protein
MLGILQAPPNTALWTRLEQEGRLLPGADGGYGDQNTLMNFVPSRQARDIGHEYVRALGRMYEPATYLERCLRQCLALTPNPHCAQQMHVPPARVVRLLALLVWHQGLRRPELRGRFWWQLGHDPLAVPPTTLPPPQAAQPPGTKARATPLLQ